MMESGLEAGQTVLREDLYVLKCQLFFEGRRGL